MNFNSLPNETVQRIVDLCHEADEAYRKRKGEKAIIFPPRKPKRKGGNSGSSVGITGYAQWWGKSSSAVSLVNKTLRGMANKYVFTTLRLSKAQDDIFLYSILGTPTGNCIHLLFFDHSGRNDLTNFVCQICPRLPNLRSIIGLNTTFAATLCLSSHRAVSISSNVATYLKSQHVRQALVQIASQVKLWDIKLNEEDTELLLSQNHDGIESLSLNSETDYGFAILESEESNFPLLLSKCTKLRHLLIRQTHSYDELIVEPVVDSVLSTSFPFAATLRSLSLDLERHGGRTTSNELTFATLFPSLEALKITFCSRSLDEIESRSFILPSLLELDIIQCPFLLMHVLLESLLLPNIHTFDLGSVDYSDFGATQDERLDEIRKVVPELGAYASTLRLLHLIVDSDLPQEALTLLSSLKTDAVIMVNSKLVNASQATNNRTRGIRRPINPASDSDSDSDSDLELLGHETRSIGFYQEESWEEGVGKGSDSTEELLDWARERMERCQNVDEAGTEEVRRVLEPVKELKEWLED